jgi:succinoglycan biosynthesis protein ExoM
MWAATAEEATAKMLEFARELHYSSNMVVTHLNIDICICTFRRGHVADTLRSISQLSIKPDWSINVIIADNDDTPSARDIVEKTARDCPYPVRYYHAPARNISVARNACLAAATAPLVAFIDDDELASPQWLTALIATQESTDADVVLGPAQAVYSPQCPSWMVKGDFHSIKPVWVGNEIITGYTSSVLFRRLAAPIEGRRFRLDLGQGGEDTMFFSEVWRAGGKIAYAPNALVTEAVPPDRATLLWLLKRRFRFGETHALILMHDHDSRRARVKLIGLWLVRMAVCMAAALLNAARASRCRYWILRGTFNCGVVARVLSGPRQAAG